MPSDHQHAYHEPEPTKQKSFWQKLLTPAALVVFAVIGFYLITEHRAHLAGFFGSFPWWILVVALCPLMHFMHGGHGGHGPHSDHPSDDKTPSDKMG